MDQNDFISEVIADVSREFTRAHAVAQQPSRVGGHELHTREKMGADEWRSTSHSSGSGTHRRVAPVGGHGPSEDERNGGRTSGRWSHNLLCWYANLTPARVELCGELCLHGRSRGDSSPVERLAQLTKPRDDPKWTAKIFRLQHRLTEHRGRFWHEPIRTGPARIRQFGFLSQPTGNKYGKHKQWKIIARFILSLTRSSKNYKKSRSIFYTTSLHASITSLYATIKH